MFVAGYKNEQVGGVHTDLMIVMSDENILDPGMRDDFIIAVAGADNSVNAVRGTTLPNWKEEETIW